MVQARSLVGLDVHATKIVAAVLDDPTGELRWFTLGGDGSASAGPLRIGEEADDGRPTHAPAVFARRSCR